MSTAFDTLRYSKRLKEVGFTEEQAEVQAEVFAEAIETQLATKRDLQELKTDLEARIEQLGYKLTIRFGGMLVAAVTVLAVLIRIL
jgi:hypothetical protein